MVGKPQGEDLQDENSKCLVTADVCMRSTAANPKLLPEEKELQKGKGELADLVESTLSARAPVLPGEKDKKGSWLLVPAGSTLTLAQLSLEFW